MSFWVIRGERINLREWGWVEPDLTTQRRLCLRDWDAEVARLLVLTPEICILSVREDDPGGSKVQRRER